MSERSEKQGAWARPNTLLMRQVAAVIEDYPALTVEGWARAERGLSRAVAAARRFQFESQQATVEIIVALVTIAARGVPEGGTVDRLVAQASRLNGLEVRRGPAIVAAIIAGYCPERAPSGRGCTFRKRVPS